MPVLQHRRHLTSTENLQPVGLMVKEDHGLIRFTSSEVNIKIPEFSRYLNFANFVIFSKREIIVSRNFAAAKIKCYVTQKLNNFALRLL